MGKRGNFETNVQIPIGILLKMKWIIHDIERNNLDERNRTPYDEVKAFILDKERKIVNRMHYEEYMQARGEEKDEALEIYLTHKKVKRSW